MNEITIHGNTGSQLRHYRGDEGKVVVAFAVAVNGGYFDRSRGEWVDKPAVWHTVVYGQLAEHVYPTLQQSGKGTLVTVTGTFADDSFRTDDDTLIRRIKLEARDVAISLRRATATVTRRPHDTTREQDPAGEDIQPTH